MNSLRKRVAAAKGLTLTFVRMLRPASRRSHFESLYTDRKDPWNLDTTDPERTEWKYDLVLDRLPKERFHSALEIGCGNGNFSRRLATRCDVLTASDISETAVEQARRRVALANVTFERCDIVDDPLPLSTYDLVVAQEVLYFVPWHRAPVVSRKLARSLSPGGYLLLIELVGGAISSLHHRLLPRMLEVLREERFTHRTGRRYVLWLLRRTK